MKNKTRGEFSFRWFKGINEINKAGRYADDMHERKTKRLRSVKYGREILETRIYFKRYRRRFARPMTHDATRKCIYRHPLFVFDRTTFANQIELYLDVSRIARFIEFSWVRQCTNVRRASVTALSANYYQPRRILIPKDFFVTSLLRNNAFDERESATQRTRARDPLLEDEFRIRWKLIVKSLLCSFRLGIIPACRCCPNSSRFARISTTRR